MKRLIGILAIAIVLVGAVFAATSNEELKITCVVASEEPTFRLIGGVSADSVPTSSDELGATSVTVSVASTIASPATHAAASTITLEGNAIIDGAVKIYCFVKQTNDDVKSLKTYSFSVAATRLSDGNGHETADPTVSTVSYLDAATATGRTVSNTNHNVVYSGYKCAAADVASFDVTWEQTDLPPATYNAYITLTITSTP